MRRSTFTLVSQLNRVQLQKNRLFPMQTLRATCFPENFIANKRSSPFTTFTELGKMKVKPELVIFDKDGTLIDFDFMWSVWVEKLAEDIADHLGPERNESKDIGPAIFRALGYDSSNRTVISKGKLCCSPMGLIRDVVKDILTSEFRLGETEAEEILESTYKAPSPDETNVRTLPENMKESFTYMKETLGLKIAVCTTDDHYPTEQMLRLTGAFNLVDVIVGGDDPVPAKPSAEQINYICEQVGVSAEKAIMVGDTNTDMSMGKNANVLMTIGIMHGASSVADLEPHADVLVPTFQKFEKLLASIC